MGKILGELSPKEQAVLKLLAEGYDNDRIAKALNCKVATIGQDLNKIYSKLQANVAFAGRNKRVAAVRIYLMATNQLSNNGSFVKSSHGLSG